MNSIRLLLALITISLLASCSYLSKLDLPGSLTGGLIGGPEDGKDGEKPDSELSTQNTLAQDMDSALVEVSRDRDSKERPNMPIFRNEANPTSNGMNKVDSEQKQVEKGKVDKVKEFKGLGSSGIVAPDDLKFLKWVEFEPQRLKRVSGHTSEIVTLSKSLSPKGDDKLESHVHRDFLISVDRSGAGLLWDVGKDSAFQLFDLEQGVESSAFSPNNMLLGYAVSDRISIYSVNAKRDVARLELPTTRVSSLAFDPAGRSLLIGGIDGKIYRWKFLGAKLANGEDLVLERYIGHSTVVSTLAFHPFGRVFFSGDWNGGFSSWVTHDGDLSSGEYDRNTIRSHIYSDKSPRVSANRPNHQAIQSLVISADGEFLLLGTQDGMLEYWSVRGFKKVGEISAHSGLVYDVAISPKGDLAASVGRDGHVKSWKIQKKGEAQVGELSYEFVVGQDVLLPRVRKVIFTVQSRLVVGEDSGKLLEIDLQ